MVNDCFRVYVCVCVCVCMCARACARACRGERERERACVYACVQSCACVRIHAFDAHLKLNVLQEGESSSRLPNCVLNRQHMPLLHLFGCTRCDPAQRTSPAICDDVAPWLASAVNAAGTGNTRTAAGGSGTRDEATGSQLDDGVLGTGASSADDLACKAVFWNTA